MSHRLSVSTVMLRQNTHDRRVTTLQMMNQIARTLLVTIASRDVVAYTTTICVTVENITYLAVR